MQELLDALRSEVDERVWSQAVTLARDGAVLGVDGNLDQAVPAQAQHVGGFIQRIMHQRAADDDRTFETVLIESGGQTFFAYSGECVARTEPVVTGDPERR